MSDTPNKPNSIPAAIAAIRTLEQLGYTYNEGASLWRPPLGKRPDFTKILLARHVENGNYWVYQGDGKDHLESLTCPVVIDPHHLRVIIENCNEFGEALQRIAAALKLPAGAYIPTDAVPAIEALNAAAKRPARRGYPFADVGAPEC